MYSKIEIMFKCVTYDSVSVNVINVCEHKMPIHRLTPFHELVDVIIVAMWQSTASKLPPQLYW